MKLGAYTACLHDRSLPESLKILAELGLTSAEYRALSRDLTWIHHLAGSYYMGISDADARAGETAKTTAHASESTRTAANRRRTKRRDARTESMWRCARTARSQVFSELRPWK